jgi:hypothetical protein
MRKRVMTLLFAVVFVFWLSLPGLGQEGAKKEEKSAAAAQDKADKKPGRWEGIITRSSPDKSTLTVRQRSSGAEKTIEYDSSTKWTAEEHHAKKVNDIDASQVKDGDRIIALGTWNKQGSVLHATRISKRLTQ